MSEANTRAAPEVEALLEALEGSGELLLREAKEIIKEAAGISRLGDKRLLDTIEAAGLVVEGDRVLLPAPSVEIPPSLRPPTSPPDNWNPPKVAPCGHLNWSGEEGDEKFCCGEARAQASRGYRTSPPLDWKVRGVFSPLPANLRRIKNGDGGFCASPKTGLYIGGLGNDCRYYSTTGEKCLAHKDS